jgi:hypothetical protein
MLEGEIFETGERVDRRLHRDLVNVIFGEAVFVEHFYNPSARAGNLCWIGISCSAATFVPSGSNLTFESPQGFPAGSLHASLADANGNFHHSQAG